MVWDDGEMGDWEEAPRWREMASVQSVSLSLCLSLCPLHLPFPICSLCRVVPYRVVSCLATTTYPSIAHAMVNESDQINRADYIPRLQYQARDTPVSEPISAHSGPNAHAGQVPRFGRPQDVKGGVTRPVRSVAWSCDGRKIATGTEVKGLRIWDAKDKAGRAVPWERGAVLTSLIQVDSSSSFSLPSGGDKTTPHTGHVGESVSTRS
jgi:WD40 repeat protein